MMTVLPWTGRDYNRAVTISGRAAMPGLPGGSGFNWRSVQGAHGYLKPRGLGRIARRRAGFRLGFRGLGDNGDTSLITDLPTTSPGISTDTTLTDITGATISSSPGSYLSSIGLPLNTGSGNAAAAQGNSNSSSAPWYASLLTSLAKTGSTIASYELNPLYQKGTYIQTPQGGIIATNQATTGGIPGLTTTTGASFLPLLLIGGGLVVVMMMAKR